MKAIPFFGVRAILVAVVALMLGSAAHAERRIALVIGNSTYQNTPALANPGNDAQDLAAALTKVGFNVDFQRNLTKQGMEAAIARFSRLAQGADAALFYYAGHGMQYRGSNYLMPTDARLEDEFNLNFELTRIDDVLFGLEGASGVKILILDSCRNNPLLDRLTRNTKSASRDLMATRGLAKINAARGMIVAYSTQANQVAVDGTGRNSPFTSALVKYLDEPGLEVGTLFRRVAIDVNKVTEGRQLPEVSVSLLGEFYLNTRETDVQAWSKVRVSNDSAQLNDFIKQYPKSTLASDARQRLESIERQNRARIEREQAEFAEKLRQQTERDRLVREKAEQARLEKDRVAQEQAADEQARRDEIARAEREKNRLLKVEQEKARIALEEAERQKASANAAENPKVAMLSPPADPAPTAPQAIEIPAILQCSSFSFKTNENPAFSIPISFNFSKGTLKGERTTGKKSGQEIYEGTVGRSGDILITGHGRYNDGSSNWTSKFSGRIGNETVLNGRLSARRGFRDCSITIRVPLPELRAKLGLLEADIPAESKASKAGGKPNSEENGSAPTAKATGNSPKVFSQEPPLGVKALQLGEIAYVDDNICPQGQIKELTGGAMKKGIARLSRCVDRSSMPAGSHRAKVVSRTPAVSGGAMNATKESLKLRGPGGIKTGETIVLTTGNGRKMTCTGGSTTRNEPRTCFWN